MNLPQITVFAGVGRYKIELTAIITDDGISATLTGGEKPHVGGVAMCLPGQNIKEKTSFNQWILPLPGHKDTVAASLVAEKVARLTGEKVVVTCGIHIDNARKEEIQKLLDNSEQAAQELAEELIKHKMRDKDA